MRDIGGVLALGVLVLLLVILLPGVLDPGKQQLRAVETTLAIEHAPARAAAVTALMWSWVVIGGVVGAGPVHDHEVRGARAREARRA